MRTADNSFLNSANLLIASVAIFFLSCEPKPGVPGICISFDDRSVKEWFALRPLLKAHGAKVTFFVSQFDSLSAAEIAMLDTLRVDGHEIASHGALHVIGEQYIKQHSYEAYLENEIDANTRAMEARQFHPTAFAYPYGSKYWFTDFLLLKRFAVTRGIAALNGQALEEVDEAFYNFDGNKKLAAAEIDGQNRLSEKAMTQALDRCVQKKEVLLLCGHEPRDSATVAYTFDPSFLKFILEEASRRQVRFYRIGDLADK